MSQQRHIIGRTSMELNTGRLADVWSLQEEASQVFYRQLVPELEQLFDRLVEPNEVVRLDQMVVNIGAISPQDLPEALTRQVVAELDRILSDRLSLLKLQRQLTGSGSTSEAADISLHDRTTANGEVLLYFLRYGRLPWWCPTEDWQVWVPRWEAALQQHMDWRQPLQTLLATNPTARQRFVMQLPAGFRQQCLLHLQPAWIGWPVLLAQARLLMQALSLSRQGVKALETQAWLLLLAEMRPDSPMTRPLPAATWVGNWLSVLVQRVLAEGAIAPEIPSRPGAPDSPSPEQAAASAAADRSSQSTEPSDQPPEQPAQRDLAGRQTGFYQRIEQQLRSALATLSASDRALWLEALPEAILSYRPSGVTLTTSDQQPPSSPQTGGQPERPGKPSPPSAPSSGIAQGQEVASATGEQRPDQREQPSEPLLEDGSQMLEASDVSPRTGDVSEPDWMAALRESGAIAPPSRPAGRSPLSTEEEMANFDQQPPSSPQTGGQPERPGKPSPPSSGIAQGQEVASATGEQCPDHREQPSEPSSVEGSQTLEPSDVSPKAGDVSEPDWMAALRESGPITSPPRRSGRSPLSTEEETAGLYIRQAGLVLLHPFLPIYLEEVGLLDGEAFRDAAAQQRAIYLLHYLATGQTTAPEPELVLPKLLCGWFLNDPVEADLDLPEAALAEGVHLLQTVIGYWEALKNTSPDGLREGFLQREGKLTGTENGWKLLVERQSIDVLLGRLPWGVSMVKLPWMPNLLTVEWT